MNAGKSVTSLSLTRLLPLLTLAAFLTACSNFSTQVDEWAKYAEAEAKVVKAAAIVEKAAVELPELPANLKRCLSQTKRSKNASRVKNVKKHGEKTDQNKKTGNDDIRGRDVIVGQGKSPSADALVLKQLEAQKRRQACADQILRWYDGIRKQKVAVVQPKS